MIFIRLLIALVAVAIAVVGGIWVRKFVTRKLSVVMKNEDLETLKDLKQVSQKAEAAGAGQKGGKLDKTVGKQAEVLEEGLNAATDAGKALKG